MAGAAFSDSDPKALDTAGEVINEKWEIISGIKQRLENTWTDEIRPQWDGNAAKKYGEKVFEFTDKIQTQLNALQELGELMGQSSANYRAQAEDVEAAIDEVDPMEDGIS